MDEGTDPVQLSKGIKISELMTSDSEFHIDLDFKQKKKVDFDDLFEVFDEENDSGEENILQGIETAAEQLMLSSPEYLSFKDLAPKMTDCVSSGDCKILIIEEGDGPLVPVDAEVAIHYAAYWEKEKIPFDSTLTMNCGAPMKIHLGTGKILPGLEIALTMVKGPTARFHALVAPSLAWGPLGVPPRIRAETALFVIALYTVTDRGAPDTGVCYWLPLTMVKGPTARFHALVAPSLAWGPLGVPPRIRAETALFVIALYTVTDRGVPDTFNSLPMEEQQKYEVAVRTVTSLHTAAKELFKKKKYKPAIKDYQQSMSILNIAKAETESEQAEVKKLRINTYVNLAMCYYKIKKPNYVISMLENLDYFTDVDKHCKALFYLGKAYESLGNSEEALKYYKKALKLEPKNKDIGKTLAELDEYLKKSAVKEKALWQNAFESEPKKETIVYDVEEDFKDGVRDMCQSLAGRKEYTKFDLPTGLTKDEVACIKSLVSEFEGLKLLEEGEGKKKKVSIIKKLLF